MFSGKSANCLDKELVDSVDLLIDGPFVQEQIDENRLLLGSKNKNLIFVSDRYKSEEKYFYTNISRNEVVVDDAIFINGD